MPIERGRLEQCTVCLLCRTVAHAPRAKGMVGNRSAVQMSRKSLPSSGSIPIEQADYGYDRRLRLVRLNELSRNRYRCARRQQWRGRVGTLAFTGQSTNKDVMGRDGCLYNVGAACACEGSSLTGCSTETFCQRVLNLACRRNEFERQLQSHAKRNIVQLTCRKQPIGAYGLGNSQSPALLV